ncbi:MAG TPA: BamA/TamA family outer membrane protein [Bacteroidales bacterium]|nr:BamA/TamA family outer membrane protein [Bacteroidales bacterium]HNS46099.1 BamA/TamA family outer membrane protein [Bacteroidales bacterium]
MKYLTVLLLLILSWSILVPDAQGQKKFSVENIINNLDSLRIAKMETGKGMLTPFIAPGYAPELKFLFTVGGLYTFKTQKNNPRLERSSIPFTISYSTNKSFQVIIKLTMYGRNDQYRILGDYCFKTMPDHYWGVGFYNGKDRNKSDTTTLYHRNLNKLTIKLIHRIGSNFFGGLYFDLTRNLTDQLNPVMEADPYIREFGHNVYSTGVGAVFQYDSRDNMVNAYRGNLLDLGVTYYGHFLGGQNEFWILELDYRGYIPIQLVNDRTTLAGEVKLRTTWGSTPWTDMSLLGNPYDVRGYYWGRFRDRSMIFGLLEYRQMLNRKKPNLSGSFQSRHGFVTWVGMGSIGMKLNDLRYWLPNAGIGYRFEIQPRYNIRVDFGIGLESKGFYFNFGEGF